MYVCMYGQTYSKSMDRPGKVANPARGQLNRENEYFPVHVRKIHKYVVANAVRDLLDRNKSEGHLQSKEVPTRS